MPDNFSDFIKRHYEIRAAAAGIRRDARREEERERRRALAGERGGSLGCLRIIVVAVASTMGIGIALVVLLVVIGGIRAILNPTPSPVPGAVSEKPAETITTANPVLAKEADPVVSTPNVSTQPPREVSSFRVSSVRLPSPYSPSAVAILTVTNEGDTPAHLSAMCNFVASDGTILDSKSVSIDIEPGAKHDEEVTGNTGTGAFQVICIPHENGTPPNN